MLPAERCPSTKLRGGRASEREGGGSPDGRSNLAARVFERLHVAVLLQPLHCRSVESRAGLFHPPRLLVLRQERTSLAKACRAGGGDRELFSERRVFFLQRNPPHRQAPAANDHVGNICSRLNNHRAVE